MVDVQVAEPVKKPVEAVEIAVAVETPQNDSSAGLARMYADLELPAAKLRGHAVVLLCISVLMCGEPSGFFGLVAAAGVLCCAAPGSLGTAYAARCTRVCALIASIFAEGAQPDLPLIDAAMRHPMAERGAVVLVE